MLSSEARVLLDPPVELVRLARNAGNMGRVKLHSLLALFLGRMTSEEERLALRHVMSRSSRGQVRRVAEALGVSYEIVAWNSLNALGVEAGFHRDENDGGPA